MNPTAGILSALVALAALAQSGRGVAPDGRRGFGQQAGLSEVLATVRSSKDEERAFMAELDGLSSEVAVLAAATLERYRQRGYLELFERGVEPTLGRLHAAFGAALADPFAALDGGGPRARVFARLFVDTRFRARLRALAGHDTEVAELRHGLAVLRGATDGFVLLRSDETLNITARIDLSASLLRAMRNDLMALRQTNDEDEVERRAKALLALVGDSEGANVRRAALERELQRFQADEDAMASALFSERLRAQCTELLDWRARVFEESVPLRDEALQWLPGSESSDSAPAEVQKLAKHERVRGAGLRATQALAIDPLDADAAWVAAHATDFLYGLVESRPWFDRFLALRGIRAHDHRSYSGRKLDARESEALEAVQRMLVQGDAGRSGPQRGR